MNDVKLPSKEDERITFHDLIAQAAAVGGPRVHADATKLADASQTRFHDDQGTYTGAHTQGGPTTTSARVDELGDLLDRSEYDVRGRKLDWQEGGARGGLATRSGREQTAGTSKRRVCVPLREIVIVGMRAAGQALRCHQLLPIAPPPPPASGALDPATPRRRGLRARVGDRPAETPMVPKR